MNLGSSLVDPPDRIEVFKHTPQGDLRMHCFGCESPASRGGIVFFFGGGWQGGTPTQFYPHARHLADHGMFAACAEYRVETRHGTPPSAAARDACSAIRWLRQNAGRFHLDPARLAAGGGSAGGHLAAVAALCPGFDEPGEDMTISRRPAALVLFNPVIDSSPGGYGHDRVDVPWERFSPLHNVTRDCPPAIIFIGDADRLVPVATCGRFRDRVHAFGIRCELCVTPGAGHGFFNYGCGGGQAYHDTVSRMSLFLAELGLLRP